jgi:hypothetical protein
MNSKKLGISLAIYTINKVKVTNLHVLMSSCNFDNDTYMSFVERTYIHTSRTYIFHSTVFDKIDLYNIFDTVDLLLLGLGLTAILY